MIPERIIFLSRCITVHISAKSEYFEIHRQRQYGVFPMLLKLTAMESPSLACLLEEATDPKSGYSVFRPTFRKLSCASIEVTSGETVLGRHIGVQHTPLATGRTKMDTCST